MKFKGREVYYDMTKSCYDCRFLKMVGKQLSGDEYYTCIKFNDQRNPYGFDSRGCTEFTKYRLPRKKKKACKKSQVSCNTTDVSNVF